MLELWCALRRALEGVEALEAGEEGMDYGPYALNAEPTFTYFWTEMWGGFLHRASDPLWSDVQ